MCRCGPLAAPGTIDGKSNNSGGLTPVNERLSEETLEDCHAFNDLVMTRTPAGRWGEPEDVGYAALFLASKASDFVNGQVLYVDGGILANFGYVKGENDIN